MADRELTPQTLLEGLRRDGRGPLPGSETFVADAVGAGFECRFEPGALAGANWLTADLLADGTEVLRFSLLLHAGEKGPAFQLSFRVLNQCQARLRLPFSILDQNRWGLGREGALLKRVCSGEKVEAAEVDRLWLILTIKGNGPARWSMTPIRATANEPPLLTDPLLPRGPLLDALGQSALHDWPGKSRSREEVARRLRRQLRDAPRRRGPETFSPWGGWRERTFEASGFFRTHHDGNRWWLVDPDGHAFWSAGVDCIRIDTDAYVANLLPALADPSPARDGGANFLRDHFVRAFGESDAYARWGTIALGLLRGWGFNTVGNWSDEGPASAARFPYVRPIPRLEAPKVARIFRDFPDVFDPAFDAEADAFAAPLRATRDDPALVGYFLMNEPQWGFSRQTPAEGMLWNYPRGPARRELARWLGERYSSEPALTEAWGPGATFERAAEGEWKGPLTEGTRRDLEAFSTVLVDRLYGALSAACRRVDPHHLNLGARYHTVPPAWAVAGMKHFDVFSTNCYAGQVRRDLGEVCRSVGRPALVGEFSFGALDAGPPAAGLVRVADQRARGAAYRAYVEDAAALPWCVGTHWFILYDQSALGRFDGECYNMGFLDVCHRPYDPLVRAARAAHRALYEVAAGIRPAWKSDTAWERA